MELHNTRLLNDRGEFYALGLGTNSITTRSVLAQVLCRRNAMDALQSGLTATYGTCRPGPPLVDRPPIVGRTPADPEHKRAWSISLYRLEDTQGRVLGVAELVVDVTERYLPAMEATEPQRRLVLIASGSACIGTTLEVEQTVRAPPTDGVGWSPLLAESRGFRWHVFVRSRTCGPAFVGNRSWRKSGISARGFWVAEAGMTAQGWARALAGLLEASHTAAFE
ncbi:PAS domain-containing protein, partial [Streptomyces sp. NPDC003015]